MNEEFAEVLSTAEADGIESIADSIKRSQICGREPREMCEGRHRDVRRAGEINQFRGFDDREERIGDGRSKSVGEVTCKLQQKKRWGRMFRVQRECMYPKPVKDVGQVRLAIIANGRRSGR